MRLLHFLMQSPPAVQGCPRAALCGVCLLCNADEHSRYGMDAFPRQLQEEGLLVKHVVPLQLVPPASGEDETQCDVLQHHIMVITHA